MEDSANTARGPPHDGQYCGPFLSRERIATIVK